MSEISGLNKIYGLAYQCPFNNRLSECPFYTFEGKSFREKVFIIKKMDFQQKQDILTKHEDCWNKLHEFDKKPNCRIVDHLIYVGRIVSQNKKDVTI